MFKTLRWATPALIAALVLSACGSSSKTASPAASATTAKATPAAASTKPVSGHTTVMIKNYMFSPMHLTVTAGTKVTFHNYDQTAHTATADNNTSFDTGTINPGKSKELTFSKPGTYGYKCLFHAFMTATITVVPKSS